ncbi:MAG: 3-dehydroquinate synthase [Candidatus Planktophila sp.]|nr:3-dehydroquinate synthase [Candidatus Planktophila sp.]
MAEIKVKAEREYAVRITGDWRGDLSPLAAKRDRVAIISSAAMSSAMPTFNFSGVEVTLIEIPDGEAGKNSLSLNFIWGKLAEAGFTRSDLIVAIGGGTVTDVAGYAAASWLRGIDWVAIPTTLAGMVDASVGGKTGINSPYGKNLIGAFHSPISVIIDPSWLRTLSDRDFAAGMAEVAKCGFIDDEEILNLIKDKSLSSIRSNTQLVNNLIERSVATKAKVVSEDFKESELREILNYGHTFGHAIERVSDYSIRHGEAVSIGMVFVAELALEAGLIDSDLLELHRAVLKSLGLPTSLNNIAGGGNWPALYAAISLDKKARGSSIRFVILNSLGNCGRLEGVTEEQLKSAYEKVLA